MTSKPFGVLADGTAIDEVVIAGGGLTVSIITWGAVVRDIRLDGVGHPLVLGFDDLGSYVRHSPYFGAVAGRYANRIAGGRLTIDGKTHQLALNEQGRTHLHGGFAGFGHQPWRIVGHDASSVTLALSRPDGDEGYPGRVDATVRYRVEAPGVLVFEAGATTDAPTVVNLAQHSYFNLDDGPDILDHEVTIHADAYTPTDADNIPTGAIAAVAGTPYDFRNERPIRMIVDGVRFPYDTNFVVAREKAAAPRPQVRLRSARSGVVLDVSSTEPGVQFYDGNKMRIPVPGLGGRIYGPSGGCCFEPQVFPDSPNRPDFPSAILRPGETYRQESRFAFSRG
ncbi:MAG TPA: aldose epimerase family protein [Bauldia sp.]|nr:aldose epimerase family protein [Bauldia sp.]